MIMELRVLEYFLAVSREKSFSRAAEAIHISQPTLSRQIADLEAELGKPLFVRGSRQLTLTDEGLILKKRAEEILRLVDKTGQEIEGCESETTGDIYIGAGETYGMHIITRAFAELRKKHPGIRLHIASGDSADLSVQLDHGLIDLGITFGKVDYDRYEYIRLPHEDVMGVYMPKDDELAEKEKIRPKKDLRNRSLIINRETKGDLIPGVPLNLFHTAGTYNLLYNATLMAEDGIGLVVGLDHIIHTEGTGLCFRPFEPEYRVSKNLIWKKHQVLSRPVTLLLEEVRKLLSSEEE